MGLGYTNLKIYTFGQVIHFLLAFSTMVALTYILSPEKYGSWAIFTQVAIFSALLSSLGIDATISTEYNVYANKENLLRELISSIFGFRVIIAIFAGLIWTILSQELIFSIDGTIFGIKSDLFFLSMVTGTCLAIVTSANSLFRIQERARNFVAVQILHPAAFFVSIFLFNFYFEIFNLDILIYIYFFCVISASILFSIMIFREFGIHLVSNRVIGAIKKDYPLVFYQFSSWSLISLDRFVIDIFGSLEAVAIYSLAYSLAMIYIPLALVLDNVYTPVFFSNIVSGKKGKIRKAAKSMMKMLSILAIIINLVALIIVEKIAPNDYSMGVWIVPWITTAGFIQSIQFIYVKPLLYHKKSGLMATICTISAITNLLLNIALIPKFGYEIAAATTLFSYGIMTIAVMRFSKNYFDFEIPWRVHLQHILVVILSISMIFSILVYFGASWAILSASIILASYFLHFRDMIEDSRVLFGR